MHNKMTETEGLLAALHECLAAADALALPVVAVRISEAIDLLDPPADPHLTRLSYTPRNISRS